MSPFRYKAPSLIGPDGHVVDPGTAASAAMLVARSGTSRPGPVEVVFKVLRKPSGLRPKFVVRMPKKLARVFITRRSPCTENLVTV